MATGQMPLFSHPGAAWGDEMRQPRSTSRRGWGFNCFLDVKANIRPLILSGVERKGSKRRQSPDAGGTEVTVSLGS